MLPFCSGDMLKLSMCACVAFPKYGSGLGVIYGPALAKLMASPAVLQLSRFPVFKVAEEIAYRGSVACGDGAIVSERVKRYFLMLGRINLVQAPASKAETSRMDKVEIAEDLDKQLCRETWKCGIISCHNEHADVFSEAECSRQIIGKEKITRSCRKTVLLSPCVILNLQLDVQIKLLQDSRTLGLWLTALAQTSEALGSTFRCICEVPKCTNRKSTIERCALTGKARVHIQESCEFDTMR
jgi:hypothetical protein